MLIVEAIKKAGYVPGKDYYNSIRCCKLQKCMMRLRKEVKKDGYYFWKTDNMFKTSDEMIDYLE